MRLIPLFTAYAFLVFRPSTAADDTTALRALVDKAIEAHGGAAKLVRYTAATWEAKGKLFILGRTTEYEGRFAEQLPKRQWFDVRFDTLGRQYRLTGAVSGDTQWLTTNGEKEQMSPAEFAEERERMHADWVATLRPLLDRSIPLAPAGETKIDGRTAVGIVVEMKGHRPVKVFFDKEKGLLLKSEFRERDVETGRESTREEFYGGHREFAGLMYHTRTKTRKDGQPYSESERSNIKPMRHLDDSLFLPR